MSKPRTFTSVSGEVYFESGNIDECISRLVSNGFSGYRSPLHSPDDVNKKPHYHIEINVPSRHGLSLKSWQDIFNVCLLSNGYVHINDRPHDYARYLCHLRNNDKQQFPNYRVIAFDSKSYSDNDLVEFGQPLPYSDYILIEDVHKNVHISDTSFVDIIKFINEHGCYNYASLLTYCINCKNEWIASAAKYHSVILTYMRSCVWAVGRNDSVADKFPLKEELKVIKNVYNNNSESTLCSNDVDCLEYLTTVLFDED